MTSAQRRVRDALTDSQRAWLEVRSYLGENRFELGRAAAAMYPQHLKIGPTPLLTDGRWTLPGPVPLSDLVPALERTRPVPASLGVDAATVVISERPDG